jgi:hypothetical protein
VQIFNLVYAFQLQMSLVCLFALAAFFATAQLASPATPGERRSYTGIAAAAVILTPYSSANGVIATVLTAALAWLLPVGWWARLIITAAAALALGGFFHGFQVHPASIPQLQRWPDTGEALTSLLGFLYALVGSIGQPHGLSAAIHLGAAGLAVWAAIAVWSIVQWRRGALDTALITPLAFATFAVATALMIACARGANGLPQALLTRYGTFSAVFFASLLGLTWQLAGRAAAWQQPLKLLVIIVGAKLLADGYRMPLEFHTLAARIARADAATADLREGRYETDAVRLFLLDPEGLRPLVEFLRARRLAFFAE